MNPLIRDAGRLQDTQFIDLLLRQPTDGVGLLIGVPFGSDSLFSNIEGRKFAQAGQLQRYGFHRSVRIARPP